MESLTLSPESVQWLADGARLPITEASPFAAAARGPRRGTAEVRAAAASREVLAHGIGFDGAQSSAPRHSGERRLQGGDRDRGPAAASRPSGSWPPRPAPPRLPR